MSDDIFDNLGGDFDEQKIALEEMAKGIVPLFKALIKEGLSPYEAAMLVTAMGTQYNKSQQDDA